MRLLSVAAIMTVLSSVFGVGQCANILFYFGVSSYSHKILAWPLAEELAARGHKVTFLSAHVHKRPNPKIIELYAKSLQKLDQDDEDFKMAKRYNGSVPTVWDEFPKFKLAACSRMLKDHEIQEWIQNSETKFDLVVIDALFNECGIGLAYKFRAKHMLFSTFTVAPWLPEIFGTDSQSSWIPDIQYYFDTPMNFVQKLYTTIAPLYWHYFVRGWSYLPKLEEILREELQIPDMPSILELEKNTSLVLLSTHFSSEYARSLPPIYVPVGGMHIADSKKDLPNDLAKFLDESGPEGVVYVSFGSYAKASSLPYETLKVFYDVFRSFKSFRFIWKFDTDRPKEMPENVLTTDWAPQQEILAHRKTRAFITHGGLGSITEATYYGKPMIVFPLFGDQDWNANIVEKSGRGVKLEITTLTEKVLREALNKIFNEPKYRETAREISRQFKDRETKPLATAVWWTEYVLRYKDTTHLKPQSMYQTWFERRLLDVWFFIFSVIIGFFYAIFHLLKKFLSRSVAKRNPNTVTKKVKRS